MDITAICLTWNDIESTKISVSSIIKEKEYSKINRGINSKIIVVDNFSEDGTREWLLSQNGIDELILCDKNYGVSAKNRGIEHSIGEYVFIFDNDISVIEDTFYVMSDFLEKCDKNIVHLGLDIGWKVDKLEESSNKMKIDSKDIVYGYTNILGGKKVWTHYGIFRKFIFDNGVKYIENDLFSSPGYGYDDDDLGMQITEMGYEAATFRSVKIYHKTSSSLKILKDKGLNDKTGERRDFVFKKWEGKFKLKGPIKNIPKDFLKDFTMNGKIQIKDLYLDDSKENSKFYSNEFINNWVLSAIKKSENYYGETDTFLYSLLDKYDVNNKNAIIIGSQTPWYECILISYGIKKCLTIEYCDIKFDHPSLKVMNYNEYEKNLDVFDFGLSISSIEHDGLGRYGDNINPNADIEFMNKMKSKIKKGGLFFLSIPIGIDKLVWNAHRIYGNIRFPYLINGWEIIDHEGFDYKLFMEDTDDAAIYQPVFVLRNN